MEEKGCDGARFSRIERWSRCAELPRAKSDKASIFASARVASARCSGAPREEGRATMHADPYSGRCYFRSILSIEEGRRTTRRARLCNDGFFLTPASKTCDPNADVSKESRKHVCRSIDGFGGGDRWRCEKSYFSWFSGKVWGGKMTSWTTQSFLVFNAAMVFWGNI